MKLEYLGDISDGGRFKDVETDELIRLYKFNKSQAIQFRDAIKLHVVEQHQELNLTTLDFIEPVNCSLTLRLGSELGIHRENKIDFICELKVEGFEKMIYLLVPFCEKEESGYQWLYDVITPIELLFSSNGDW